MDETSTADPKTTPQPRMPGLIQPLEESMVDLQNKVNNEANEAGNE